MKTAIVTWISYNNYGTLLQAYALQQQLNRIGIKSTILCDRMILDEHKAKNPLHVKDSQFVCNDKEKKLARLCALIHNPKRLGKILEARVNRTKYERPYTESQDLCNLFKERDLSIYYDVFGDNLTALNNCFDAFIAGSDQVWSVFENAFNPYYFLDFVTRKKISYAPSLGTSVISQNISEQLKKLLDDYDNISVREKTTAEQLSGMLRRKVDWVVDPTLLHDREFWEQFTSKIPRRKKRYLLCYFLENRKWYFSYAKKLAKELHLELLLLPNRWDYISSEYVVETGVGPKEFVSLIRHSDYVLTDSYHGSIFSLIFQRDFQYLLRFNNDDQFSQNIRIQSLFDSLDLKDRIVCAGMEKLPTQRIENYKMVTSKIEEMRCSSQQYLQNCFAK